MDKQESLLGGLASGNALVRALKAAALLCVFAALVFLVSAFTAAGGGSGLRACLEYAGFSLAVGLLTLGQAEVIRWLQKVWKGQQEVFDRLEAHGVSAREHRSRT